LAYRAWLPKRWKKTAIMADRFLFFVGSAIIATTLALLATYHEYKILAETITVIVGTTGGFLSIIEYFRRRK